MTHENAAHCRKPLLRASVRPALALVFLLLASCAAARAQSTTSATDGSTPEGMKPGAPAGSYQLSGFDSVNFFNGNLNFNLTLLQVGGRGSASSAVSLTIERKWSVARTLSNPATYWPETGGWSGLKVGYGPGVLIGRLAGASSLSCGGDVTVDSLLRLTFIASDGTEYELHDTAMNGYRGSTHYTNCQVMETTARGREFVTADGASATFISDEVLQDGYDGAPEQKKVSGSLMLRDGTRYRIREGLVDWVRDRNGNKVSYEYAGERVTKITDSLGREVTFSYGPTLPPPYSDTITYTGFGGAPRTVRVWYGLLGTALRGDQTPKSEHDLFPSLNGADSTGYFERTVATSVELPDGRSYRFKYNSYGELARVELPTGGAFEYDWDGGFTPNSPGLYFVGPASTGSYQVYRRVVERRVYPDGGAGSSFASRMTIGRPEEGTPDLGYAEVKNYDHTGTTLTCERHYFYGSARVRADWKSTDYEGWKTGRGEEDGGLRPGRQHDRRRPDDRADVVAGRRVARCPEGPVAHRPAGDPRPDEARGDGAGVEAGVRLRRLRQPDGRVGLRLLDGQRPAGARRAPHAHRLRDGGRLRQRRREPGLGREPALPARRAAGLRGQPFDGAGDARRQKRDALRRGRLRAPAVRN